MEKTKSYGAYTEDNKWIIIPDIQVIPTYGDIAISLRGHKYIVAVIRNDSIIGFALKSEFENSKALEPN